MVRSLGGRGQVVGCMLQTNFVTLWELVLVQQVIQTFFRLSIGTMYQHINPACDNLRKFDLLYEGCVRTSLNGLLG